MDKNNLRDIILSDDNIFKAIFSLKSYIYDVKLLSENDIKLFYQLQDHYCDHGETIKKCRERLLEILDSEDKWFNVNVYFKLKKFDKEKDEKKETPKYRPIHTASLTDLICMVSMLQPLMFEFDEQGKKKKLSGLSQLLPHNFFGNIPSTKANELFRPWKNQYKHYTENTILKLQKFQQTKEYNTEILLDLKNFFPTVSPLMVMNYVYDKIKNRWIDEGNLEIENPKQNENNKKTLIKVLSRLLIQKIYPNNNDEEFADTFKDWIEVYYKDTKITSKDKFEYFTLGLAQGLPQSYFFGNIAMIEISKLIQETLGGESFFYVDDSVTFANIETQEDIQNKLTEELEKHIETLNDQLEIKKKQNIQNLELFIEELEIQNNEDYKLYQEFEQGVIDSYKIEFHPAEDSKSQAFDLEQDHLGKTLGFLAREVSIAGNLYNNTDEQDDTASIRKLNILRSLIKKEKENLEEKEEKQEQKFNPKDNKSSTESKKIKLLNQYNKYFSFREQLLTFKQKNKITKQYLEKIYEKYLIDTKKFFKELEQTNFEHAIGIILDSSTKEQENDILDNIKTFEKKLFTQINTEAEYDQYRTYFSTIFSKSKLAKQQYLMLDKYSTLRCIFRSRLSNNMTTDAKLSCLRNLAKQGERYLLKFINIPSEELFAVSNSYKRPIVNAYLSVLFDVEISDNAIISKCNSFKSLTYEELRLLAYARNPLFKMEDFLLFLNEILNHNNFRISSYVEPSLLPVLEIFIKKIRNPRHVDSMIEIHKLVSGLWLNGSKFLHSYTLHNQDHAIALVRLSLKLINSIDYLKIKQNDYFVLFMACYLHDISMVINPSLNKFKISSPEANDTATRCLEEMINALSKGTKNDINTYKQHMLNIFNNVYNYFSDSQRNSHPKDSATFVIKHAHDFLSFVDDAVLQIVANVGASHGYDTEEVYGRKSNAKNELFSVKYLMILIRLADSMDITSDRINYFLLKESMEHLSSTSKFHWISHYITEDIEPISKYQMNEESKQITEKVTIKITYKIRNNTHIKSKYNCNSDNQENFCTYKGERNPNSFKNSISNTKCKCQYLENNKYCPLLCLWTHKKNGYLFTELASLQNYLNKVNPFGIKTEFSVRIIMKNDTLLDQEFFDAAINYMENN